MFTLADDGTLDTVLECEDCGVRERYNYANTDGFNSYDAFVGWALQDVAEEHECEDATV